MNIRIALCCLIGLAVFSGAGAHAATPLPIDTADTRLLVRLYADAEVGDIIRVAGQGRYLYTAVRDLSGEQHIDVWEIRPPAQPRLVDSLSYGNVLDNTFAFIPMAILTRNGVVLIQADEILRTYRHRADGTLEQLDELNPVTFIGPALMSQLSAGGAFASHLQQVVFDDYIGDVPQEFWHQEVIISLENPAHPFLVRQSAGHQFTPYLHTPQPVNTTLNGEPASVTYDWITGEVTVTALERRVDSHLNTFWPDKLDALFQDHALDASIGALIEAALDRLDLPALRAQLLAGYQAALDRDGQTVEALIRGEYAASASLASVLEAQGITLDMSVRAALAELTVNGLNEDLAVALGADLYGLALKAWLDETFGVAWQGRASADIAAELALAFNAELDAEGVAAYLTFYVIAPMLDNPDFMTWTLDELIDAIVASDVGALIDAALTVTGLGAMGEVLAFIDEFPGVDLPNCALFPGSARGLINLALFSGGADLQANGLAWFELMKFYQYLTGHFDFTAYVAELDAALRGLHLELATDFTEQYVGFFSGAAEFLNSAEAFAEITAAVPADQLIGELLAGAMLDGLALAGIEGGMSVEAALETLGLAFDADGEVDASIDEFIAAIAVPDLHLRTMAEIFAEAQLQPFDLEAHLRAFLQAQIQATFGLSLPDLTLRAAVTAFITEQLDLGGSLGAHLGAVLGGIVSDFDGNVVFGRYLTTAANAFGGDCIAQWIVSLDVAAGIMALANLEVFPLAAEAALSEAYQAGVQAMLSAMIGAVVQVVIGDLAGHYPSWTERIVPQTAVFNLPLEENGYDITVRGAFAWQDQVLVVLEYRSQAAPFAPRPVVIHRFQPGHAEGTLQVFEAGAWEHLDFLHQAGPTLYLGGRHSIGGGATHSALLVNLDTMRGRQLPVTSSAALGAAERVTAVNDGAALALAVGGEVLILTNAQDRPAHLAGHAGDPDRDGQITLAELLRVIQLFNFGEYYCANAASEDGYAPQTGHRSCTPHSSDYNPQDWRISLSELLRFIQFYNLAGYAPCPGSEDGYCAQSA